MFNSTLNPVLQKAIADVYDRLTRFAQDPLFTENMKLVFGGQGNITPQRFLTFLPSLPKIEVRQSQEIGGAWGAFSAQTNTIYLSKSLLTSSQSNQLTAVLLEEIGHYLDSRLNKVDTKGDEGELFSAVVRGINLSPTELTRIQTENDQKQIILDGKLLTIEQSDTFINRQIIGQGYIPRVSGNNVVWEYRGTVYFWDSQTVIQLAKDAGVPIFPSVSGSNVIWQSHDSSTTRIYFWDGNSTTQIADYNYTSVFLPQVSGQNVVWSAYDGNDNEIYFWNGNSTTQITNNSVNESWDTITSGDTRNISGQNVVWSAYDGNDNEIYFWNGNTTIQITNNSTDDSKPEVSGNNVVWSAYDGNDNEIYFWNGNTTRQITNNSTDDSYCHISGNNIVWVGEGSNSSEIYFWNGNLITQVTNNSLSDTTPQISGNNIVWQQEYTIYYWNSVSTILLSQGLSGDFIYPQISGNNVTWSSWFDSQVYFISLGSENFITTPQFDSIYADDGDDTVTSTFANLQQNDIIDGGTGTDTFILTNGTITNNMVINVSDTTNQVSSIHGTTISNFEHFDLSGFLGTTNFTGSTGDDWITSGAGNDSLSGGNGNDDLNGGLGADQLSGGLGDDAYVVDNISDLTTESINAGIDTVASSVSWTLKANFENLTLTGIANLNGTGNELNNSLVGNTGNNTLDGGLGADRLSGGLGNDTYIVDNIRDSVTENLNEGNDLVQSTVNTTLTNHVENLTLLGTANLYGTGNNLDNTLTGNSGANLLKGVNGNDTLLGGAGNDTLIGGLGNDRLVGEGGADQFLFGSGSAFKSSNLGVDTLTDFTTNSDKIALSKVTFNALTSPLGTLQSAEFVQINSLSNELSLVGASSAKMVYNVATGNLFYNPDGAIAGLSNGGQFAILSNRPNLSATDFFVQA